MVLLVYLPQISVKTDWKKESHSVPVLRWKMRIFEQRTKAFYAQNMHVVFQGLGNEVEKCSSFYAGPSIHYIGEIQKGILMLRIFQYVHL